MAQPIDQQAWPGLPSPAGMAVGAYVLQCEIGHGGMGSVWLAQRACGRYEGQAAIKFMHLGLQGSGVAERFEREGQLLARLDHPHIARLLDAGVLAGPHASAGQPYLVLEYVQGLPIDQHCQARALDARARVQLMLAVLGAVAHAHSRLILHCDLKPSNILVTPSGSPKLLDFGVGKLLADAQAAQPGPADATAHTLQAFTTPFTTRYAAPEQLQQQEVTTATDVYALGVLLYELLGGGHPTAAPGTTPLQQMQAVAEAEPPRLSEAVRRQGGAAAARQARALRGDLDSIVARALKKRPAQRYAHAGALADDLRRWLDHEPVVAQGDGAAYRVGRLLRRHAQVALAAGTAGTLALAGGAALALWQAQQARNDRAQAEALVEFMLGDLQARLDDLGRTDLLQSVGERALAYYGDERQHARDAQALSNRAQALRVIGESARQRLDWPQALRAFEQASQTTARLAELEPANIQRLHAHATSLERMAELQARTNDEQTQQELGRQISALRWRIVELAPADDALRLQALIGDQWMVSTKPEGHAQASLDLLARGQQAMQALPPALPGLQRARAISSGLAGQALMELGRYREASDAFRRFLAQRALLPAGATLVERREDRIIQRTLALALLNQGQPEEAAALLQELLDPISVDLDSAVKHRVLMEERSIVRLRLAEALWLAGEHARARTQLAAAEAELQGIGDVAPEDISWNVRTKGIALLVRLRLYPQAGPADARHAAALQALAGQMRQLRAQGTPLRGSLLHTLQALELARGDLLMAQGQTAAAREQWQALASDATTAAQAGGHLAMKNLALVLLRLGQPQQAQAWVQKLQAGNWRHPDLGTLQAALDRALGGADPASAR